MQRRLATILVADVVACARFVPVSDIRAWCTFARDRLLNQRQSLIICVATPGRSGATTCGWGNPCRSRGALPGLATSAPEQPMLCAPIVSHTCAATLQISDGDTFNSSATM